MIKLIALDIDGTILRRDRTLSKATVRAVRHAEAKGFKVTLCTGRSLADTLFIARQLGVTAPIITDHGALVTDPVSGKPLLDRRVPAELAAVFSKTLSRWSGLMLGAAGPGLVIERQRFWITRVQVPPLRDLALVERLRFWREMWRARLFHHQVSWVGHFGEYKDGYNAVTALGAPADLVDEALDLLPSGWQEVAHIERLGAWFDLLPAGCDKAAGLAWVAERLGVLQAQVAAVGDGDNDLPMLRWAGLGVAMGNGRPAAKEAADMVIGPNGEDGLAKWLLSTYK